MSSYKTTEACKITVADLWKRLETLECGAGIQETKIFFIDESSDKALTKSSGRTLKPGTKPARRTDLYYSL